MEPTEHQDARAISEAIERIVRAITSTLLTAKAPTPVAYGMDEAAAACGVSRGTLNNALQDGELTARLAGPKGGRIIVERTELEQWAHNLAPYESPRYR